MSDNPNARLPYRESMLRERDLNARETDRWKHAYDGLKARLTSLEAEVDDAEDRAVAAEERAERLEKAIRAVRWNVEDGFDENSAFIVDRAAWRRLRASLEDKPDE